MDDFDDSGSVTTLTPHHSPESLVQCFCEEEMGDPLEERKMFTLILPPAAATVSATDVDRSEVDPH